MVIGRIIAKNKNIETLDFVEIVENAENLDKSIPTLIIGKKNVEKYYNKEKIHVLDKKIEDNVYWTFGKLERRNDFENDLNEFNKILVKNLFEKVIYEYVDVFNTGYTKIKELLLKITKLKTNVFYTEGNHIYAYIDGTVYGLNFNETEYIGVQKDKILEKIKKNRYNKIITNNYFISKNTRKYLNNSKIIVPYIYFLAKS